MSKVKEEVVSEYKNFDKYPKTKVKKGLAGLGLFADEDIKKGTYIVQYVGEKISNKIAAEKPNRYIFDLNTRWALDGSSRLNVARYVNHVCKIYNADSALDRGKIFYEANRNIKKGEEITTDYGEEYFEMYLKPAGCRCVSCKKDDKVV